MTKNARNLQSLPEILIQATIYNIKSSKYCINEYGTIKNTTLFDLEIESGVANQFVDEETIKGNFAKSYNPFREFFLLIHTSMKQFFPIMEVPPPSHEHVPFFWGRFLRAPTISGLIFIRIFVKNIFPADNFIFLCQKDVFWAKFRCF